MNDNHESEHGIESAYYANGPSGFLPMLECSCGYHTSRSCQTWQEAGEEFDVHLEGDRIVAHRPKS